MSTTSSLHRRPRQSASIRFEVVAVASLLTFFACWPAAVLSAVHHFEVGKSGVVSDETFLGNFSLPMVGNLGELSAMPLMVVLTVTFSLVAHVGVYGWFAATHWVDRVRTNTTAPPPATGSLWRG